MMPDFGRSRHRLARLDAVQEVAMVPQIRGRQIVTDVPPRTVSSSCNRERDAKESNMSIVMITGFAAFRRSDILPQGGRFLIPHKAIDSTALKC